MPSQSLTAILTTVFVEAGGPHRSMGDACYSDLACAGAEVCDRFTSDISGSSNECYSAVKAVYSWLIATNCEQIENEDVRAQENEQVNTICGDDASTH
jgi:hypothetical protein